MKKEVQEVIKQYMRSEMLKTRTELKITQVEMARRLRISSREYTNIESGISCCNTITFLVYMQEFCRDTQKFLDGLKEVLESGRTDVA